MLIIDFSAIMVANMYALFGHTSEEIEEDLLRHMILNTVRSIRKKFSVDEYGEIIVACDGRSWRRDYFQYYKANRDKNRSDSVLDWKRIFEIFTRVRNDLKEYFPYRVVEVSRAEADDVIGTLVMEFGVPGPIAVGEPILIISGDKDFSQLHRYGNVQQYDPIKKTFVQPNMSADEYLLEHIIRGDSGDGIPNILSDDDTFMIPGKRQKTMTKQRLAKYKEVFSAEVPEEDKEILAKYIRNRELIDLRKTPDDIRKAILAAYDAEAGKDRSKIFNYLIKNRLRNLIEAMGDF